MARKPGRSVEVGDRVFYEILDVVADLADICSHSNFYMAIPFYRPPYEVVAFYLFIDDSGTF